MDWLAMFITSIFHVFLKLVSNPFYYLGLFIVFAYYRKQIRNERKLFHSKLHSVIPETWNSLIWGWASGIVVSFVFIFFKLQLQWDWLFFILCLSFFLTIFRTTFSSVTYAVGLIGLLQGGISYLPDMSQNSWFTHFKLYIENIHVLSLLLFVGVLYLIEGLLIMSQSARKATPIFTLGKRGHTIGAYQTEAIWVVPLFILVPFQDSLPAENFLSTFFQMDLGTGWGFIISPVIIGFSHFSISKLPQEQAQLDGKRIFISGCILILVTVVSMYLDKLIYFAAFLSIFLREGWSRMSLYLEKSKPAFFVQHPQGLRVLAIIPKSPAEKLGIEIGEIIHRVNGTKIKNREDFYLAMQRNSAFCKLEIINLDGESKFVNTPLYEDEHHELGIIYAPEPHSRPILPLRHSRIWDYFRK